MFHFLLFSSCTVTKFLQKWMRKNCYFGALIWHSTLETSVGEVILACLALVAIWNWEQTLTLVSPLFPILILPFPLFNTHFQTVVTVAAAYLGQLLINFCKSLPDKLVTLLLLKIDMCGNQVAHEIFWFSSNFLILWCLLHFWNSFTYATLMDSLHSHSAIQLKNATITMITEGFEDFVTLKQAVRARQFMVSHKKGQNQKVRSSVMVLTLRGV